VLSDGFTHVIINKMENKLENKEKFFALYFKQDLLRINKYPSVKIQINSDTIFDKVYNQDSYLLLKSIESINEEEKLSFIEYFNFKNYKELIELGEAGKRILIKQYEETVYRARINQYEYSDFQRYYADWFRKNGFACEWLKLTIKDQIEYGWIRLLTI
jgi:hypothetical protein